MTPTKIFIIKKLFKGIIGIMKKQVFFFVVVGV